MRKLAVIISFMTGWGSNGFTQGATIPLKDGASVTGHILVEKVDQVVIDLGFTVLVVPRDHIIGPITELPSAEAESDSQLTAGSNADRTNGLFHVRHVDGSLPYRTVRSMVGELGEAVVQIRTPSGSGSGFIINDQGYLITNFHVIENETQISVEVYQREQDQLERNTYKEVRIVALHKFADLALLQIEDEDADPFAYVLLGDSGELTAGDRVFAIGSPLGLERTVTEGIISTTTRLLQGNLYLQTSTQINPGNSGGPLFNLRGEVVGVTNMKVTFAEGLAFAIPIDSVKQFLNYRDAFAYDQDNPSNPFRYLPPPQSVRLDTENK